MIKIVMSIYFLLTASVLNAFQIDHVPSAIAAEPRLCATMQVNQFFNSVPARFKKFAVVTDPCNLQQTAKDILLYFDTHATGYSHVTDPQGFRNLISYDEVRSTLQFIIDTVEADKESGRYRILDPIFLKHHFNCFAWNADWQSAKSHNVVMPEDGRIRLTTYCILSVNASYKKTSHFPCGLYLLLDQGIKNKYTKQQILAGVLEHPENRSKRKPLAWVCRQDLEDALMQGTVIVNFPDGTSKVLNVNCNNGIAYNRKQKNALAQKRYWFFHELKSSCGVEETIDRFKRRKNVIFAGDLWHIGLGKVIALTYENPVTNKSEMRIGLLADTGGAFKNNLYQLDLFGGVFNNRHALRRHIQSLPASPHAYILCKKSDTEPEEDNT